jgi:hypothetical protein
VNLELESGKIIESATLADLRLIEGEEFAILSDGEATYMQCAAPDGPDDYLLEYQIGSLSEHFHAVDGPITLNRVLAAMRSYLQKDDAWKTDFQWEKMEL